MISCDRVVLGARSDSRPAIRQNDSTALRSARRVCSRAYCHAYHLGDRWKAVSRLHLLEVAVPDEKPE